MLDRVSLDWVKYLVFNVFSMGSHVAVSNEYTPTKNVNIVVPTTITDSLSDCGMVDSIAITTEAFINTLNVFFSNYSIAEAVTMGVSVVVVLITLVKFTMDRHVYHLTVKSLTPPKSVQDSEIEPPSIPVPDFPDSENTVVSVDMNDTEKDPT